MLQSVYVSIVLIIIALIDFFVSWSDQVMAWQEAGRRVCSGGTTREPFHVPKAQPSTGRSNRAVGQKLL